MQIEEVKVKPKWQWFMAVNTIGGWLTLEGIATVSLNSGLVSGSLFFDLESFSENEKYASFVGNVNESGELIALEIESRDHEVPSFKVSGRCYVGEGEDHLAKTIILTDGTTVLGLSQFEKVR